MKSILTRMAFAGLAYFVSTPTLADTIQGFLEIRNKLNHRLPEVSLNLGSYSVSLKFRSEIESRLLSMHGKFVILTYKPDEKAQAPIGPKSLDITSIEIPLVQEVVSGEYINDLVGIGGETTGYGIRTADGHIIEIQLTEELRNGLVNGTKVGATGVMGTIKGVETGNRSVLFVESMRTALMPPATQEKE